MKLLTKNYALFLSALIPLSILLLTQSSCGENVTETFEQKGKDYYPLSIGKSITYNVDSVIYDPQSNGLSKIDTTYWQFKEDIVDTFRGKDGSLQYKIERSERRKGATNWVVGKVLSTSINAQNVLRDEDNMRFVKFPIAFIEKTTWDGNIYNEPSVVLIIAGELLLPFSKKWESQIESFGKKDTIGGKVFDDVLTVVAKTDSKILTETRSTVEKYAKGVGLVSRVFKVLDTQKLDANITWEKKAEKGVIIRQTFVQ